MCKKGQNRLGPSLETGYHNVFIIFISFSVKYLFISLVSFFIGLFSFIWAGTDTNCGLHLLQILMHFVAY